MIGVSMKLRIQISGRGFMKERRAKERLKDFNEISVSIISEEQKDPESKITYNYTEDISVAGTKIRGSILLPVDTVLKIDFALETLKKQITTVVGKVKWIKVVIEDKHYEAGVEFVDTPNDVIRKIEDYILWKKKNKNLNPFNTSFWISAKISEPESKQK